MKKKLLSIFLSFLMVFNILIPTISYAAEDNSSGETSKEIIGHVVFDVEKFALGLGYIQEPIIVPIYEGENCAQVVVSTLGEENVKYQGDTAYGFYLKAIRDDDDTEIEGFRTGRKNPGWLGEFDYSGSSGWVYSVNRVFPNTSMGNYILKDGDVLSLKFTGGGFVSNTEAEENLVKAVAKINSADNKNELLSYQNIRAAYKKANQAITDGASDDELVQLLADLNKAVENIASDSKAIPMTGLTLDKTEIEVSKGKKIQLNPTISPSNTTDDTTIKWKTSNSEVANVNQKGLVTARGEGTCKIYAYAGDFRAQFSITVKNDTSKEFSIEDGVLLSYNGDQTEVTIPDGVTVIGDSAFRNLSKITSIKMPESVTTIEDDAFYGCTSLTSINLPDSVTTIGDKVFASCSRLSDVQLPKSLVSIGNYAFYECKSLKSLTMPSSLKTIGNYAFYYCSGVTELTLNEGLESIGNAAFYSVKMKSLTIPSTVKTIGKNAFYYCSSIAGEIILPEGLTEIGEAAFRSCSNITDVKIPSTLSSIKANVFASCSKLKSIKIDGKTYEDENIYDLSNLTEIGSGAFSGNTSIENVILNKELKALSSSVFQSCSKLKSIRIDGKTYEDENIYDLSNLTEIGSSAFSGNTFIENVILSKELKTLSSSVFQSCSKLKSIKIDGKTYEDENIYDLSNLTEIGSSAFSGNTILENVILSKELKTLSSSVFQGCKALVSIELPSSLEEIGNSAFYNTGLKSIVIPEGVKTIGNSVFYSAASLTEVKLPNSLEIIGDSAFCNTGLKSIEIPEGVKTIGKSAFFRLTNLTEVKLPNSLETIGNSAFYNTGLKSIEIPEGVKTIGDSAFYNTTSLTEVKLPNSLETIENLAFSKCTALKTITIPKSVTSIGATMLSGATAITEILVEDGNENYKSVDGVLYTTSGEIVIYPEGKTNTELVIPDGTMALNNTLNNKTKIKKVTIPASVKTIDGNVFIGCTSLESIEVAEDNENFKAIDGVLYDKSGETLLIYPTAKTDSEYTVLDGCTSLQKDSFKGNNNITTLNMPLSLEVINSSAINNAKKLVNVNMNEKATKIVDNAFKSCSKLTNITYPNTIESIGSYAFYGTKITTLNIPQTIKSIGKYAFGSCSSIASEVVIPEGVTVINEYTFNGCSNIPSIKLPDSITEIGANAFNNCSKLTSMKLPEGINKIGNGAFNSCTKLQSINIPSKITELNTSTFYNCYELDNVELPSNLQSIGSSAFYNCKKLTSIKIPESIKTIEQYTFYNCYELNNVELPSNLETIKNDTFYNCKKLTSIKIPKTVQTIGQYAFNNCTDLSEVIIYSKDAQFSNTVFGSNSQDLTLYGYEGSTAETYANEKSLKFVPFTSNITFKADDVEIDEQGTIEGLTVSEPQAPTKEGYTFVGWFKDVNDITTEFDSQSTYDQDVTYTAKYAHVDMLGAQGKLIVNDKSGIRFGTKIYKDGDEIVEMGTIILPQNLLPEGTSLTLDTPKIAKSIAKVLYENNIREGYVTYLGTLANITSSQFDREITASSYVKYKDSKGNEYVVYSPYKGGSISINQLIK